MKPRGVAVMKLLKGKPKKPTKQPFTIAALPPQLRKMLREQDYRGRKQPRLNDRNIADQATTYSIVQMPTRSATVRKVLRASQQKEATYKKQLGAAPMSSRFLPHHPSTFTITTKYVDEEAWLRYNYGIWQQRKEIYDNALTGSPNELYMQYPTYKPASEFTTYDNPTGKFLCRVDNLVMWCNDAAELATLANRPIARHEWETLIIDWRDDAAKAEWEIQRNALSPNYHVKIAPRKAIAPGTPIEVYDANFQLLCVCASQATAEAETGVQQQTIWYAYEHATPTNNLFFRYFYDNNFNPKPITGGWKKIKSVQKRQERLKAEREKQNEAKNQNNN